MSEKSDYVTGGFWDRCLTYQITEQPQPSRTWQLHCLPDQRLRQGDEVVVTIGGKMVLRGTVETRFPNVPRRLTIRYTAANGTTGISRAWGTLPGPPEYVGTKYETKVLRVVAKSMDL